MRKKQNQYQSIDDILDEMMDPNYQPQQYKYPKQKQDQKQKSIVGELFKDDVDLALMDIVTDNLFDLFDK